MIMNVRHRLLQRSVQPDAHVIRATPLYRHDHMAEFRLHVALELMDWRMHRLPGERAMDDAPPGAQLPRTPTGQLLEAFPRPTRA